MCQDGNGVKIGALLTISVEYDVPPGWTLARARSEILGLLDYVAQHAANEGLLSGDSELTVDRWWNKQVILVGQKEAVGQREAGAGMKVPREKR